MCRNSFLPFREAQIFQGASRRHVSKKLIGVKTEETANNIVGSRPTPRLPINALAPVAPTRNRHRPTNEMAAMLSTSAFVGQRVVAAKQTAKVRPR